MDQIQDDLTCQICYGYYKNPKALPCIHSFCEGCIRDYVFSRGFDATGHFPCPLCRADTTIPACGVALFPLNHLLQSLIDTLRQSGNLVDSIPSNCEDLTAATPGNNNSTNGHIVAADHTRVAGDIGRPHSSNGLSSSYNRPSSNTRTPSRVGRQISNGSPRAVTPTAPTVSRPSSPPVLRVSNMGAHTSALDIPIRYSQHRAEVLFGKYGSGLGHFTQPMGLCFTNHYGESLIHITDQRDTRIMTFKLDGKINTIFTTEGKLWDITSDGMNALFVAVSNAPNKEALVLSYDLHGTPISKYGNMFSFVKPDGVAINKFGYVIVTSVEEKQVYIFNSKGTLVQKFGKKGSGPDAFLTPYHVACNSYNQIIVSDCDSNCLKVFDRHGKSKFTIGQKGRRLGQLFKPQGLAVDQNNDIIVADAGNNRIQIFDSSGKFQDVFISELDKQGFPSGCSVQPYDIAVSPGRLAVLFKGGDFAEVRVYEYHSQSNNARPSPLSNLCTCQ